MTDFFVVFSRNAAPMESKRARHQPTAEIAGEDTRYWIVRENEKQ